MSGKLGDWLNNFRSLHLFPSIYYFFRRGFHGSGDLHSLSNVHENKHVDDDSEVLCLNDNARSLHKNNEIVMSITKAFRRDSIGKEISIQFRTPNENLNNQLEALFEEWSEVENMEISGKYYRGLMERSLVRETILTGGFIVKHHYNDKWKFGYKVELIPLNLVDATRHEPEKRIINGYVLNRYNQKIAVYIYDSFERDKSTRVSAKDLTIFLDPEFELDQTTPVSLLSPAINGIDTLSSYEEAEVKSARVRSENKIVVKTSMFNDLKLALKRKFGDISPSNITDLYDTFKMKESFGISYVPSTDEVQNLSVLEQSQFDTINQHKKKTISSSVGLSSQSTVRDLPSSYNASLLALQLDDKETEIMFTNIIGLALKEIYRKRFVNAVMLKKMVSVPYKYWEHPRKWQSIQFLRKSINNLDPVKDTKADSERIASGMGNPIQMLGKHGIDWRTHIDDIAKFNEYCKSKGVEFNNDKEVEPTPPVESST